MRVEFILFGKYQYNRRKFNTKLKSEICEGHILVTGLFSQLKIASKCDNLKEKTI